jgi:hypothetical protein
MPYPMVKSPKRDEFIDQLRKYQVTLEKSKGTVIGPRGPVTLTYLKRVLDGKTHIAVLPDVGPDECIMFTVVRSILVQLRIPPKEFGFVLDELPQLPSLGMPKDH